MPAILRPMNTGEVLDRTFNLYRNNFGLFAGIALLPATLSLVWDLIQYGIQPDIEFLRQNPYTRENITTTLIMLLVVLFGSAIATAATVYAVSLVHLEKKATIGQCYQGMLPRLLPVTVIFLSTVIVIAIVCFGLVLLPAGILIPLVSRPSILIVTIIAVILCLVVAGHVYAHFSMAPAACIVEKIGAFRSLARSVKMAKKATGRIWLVLLLYFIISIVLGFLFGAPAGYLGALSHSAPVAFALTTAAKFIAGVLAAPLLTIPLVLTYYDQRVRNEAFDLQLMMEAIGQAVPPEASAAAPVG